MAIDQTPDGFLWLGTRQGLFRFDGLRFERITEVDGKPIVDDEILSLRAESDGTVWVGYFNGGMSRVGGSKPFHYEYQRDDIPYGSVLGFGRDASGRLWAATPEKVVRLDEATDKWKSAVDFGFQADWAPKKIFTDREGGLWVAFSQGEKFGIAHLAPKATRFESIARPVQQPYLSQAPDGTLWAANYWGVRPLAQALPDPRNERASITWLRPDFKAGNMMFDSDGAMWIATVEGIARVRDPNALHPPIEGDTPLQPEIFGTAQGLTSEVVWDIFEDREGNIWTGTANGLDRFRDNALAYISLPRRAQAFSIEAGTQGQIWAGNADRGPMLISPDADQPNGAAVVEMSEGIREGVTAFHRQANGTVWIGGSGGHLWQHDASGIKPVDFPEEAKGAGLIVMIASDREGAIWVSKVNSGLMRFYQGKWELLNKKYGLQASTPRAFAEDSKGRIWMDAGQTIRVIENGKKRDFKEDGPGIARIAVLRTHADELWAGGIQGVAVRMGERFHRLMGRGGEKFERTVGMVILPDGEMWFGGRPGVTRVPASEIQRWKANPSYQVAFERFGLADGLRGTPEHSGAFPSAVADNVGRVWFATNGGVHWIDPKHIIRNPASTPLIPALLGLMVDDKPLRLADQLHLPVGSRDLRIAYTAPGLRVPERVRFRYRLDGLDSDWQEAGTRRQAVYSRLAPGSYKFRVIASDDAGRWWPQEASLNFVVPPAFWQTAWFALASLLLAIGLVWLLVRWRVATARSRLDRIYRARVGERERIARDLHDTLLQSVQALVLRVETARGRVARGEQEEAKAGLTRALEEAEAGLAEGRDRIAALRREEDKSGVENLESALGALPAQLDMPPTIEYSVVSSGRPVQMPTYQRGEVYWICREAVSNAVQHASATRIEVSINYGWLNLSIDIEDNGCGISQEVMRRGGSEGHWGLTGMRERAAAIGARVVMTALPQGGTQVRLRIRKFRIFRTHEPATV